MSRPIRWSRLWLLGQLGCLVLLLASCRPLPHGPSRGEAASAATAELTQPAAAQAGSASGPDEAPGATPQATEPASRSLAGQIDELLDGRQGRYSVVVMTPDGTPLYRHLADEQQEAASLYKLGIMIELYRERQAGTLSFSEQIELDPAFFLEDDGEDYAVDEEVSIADLLEQMITVSSNVAAAALLYRVGNEQVNATLASLGLASTEIRWMPLVEPDDEQYLQPTENPETGEKVYNLTSASDVARLFQFLLAGQVVSPTASHDMLALLARQQINDRLPARLPPDAVVAHKTGNLDGEIHDAGVIYTPTGPVIVAVLSHGVLEDEAVDFIAALGGLIYEAGQPG